MRRIRFRFNADSRIVIDHVVKPWYKSTVTLTARGEQRTCSVDSFEPPSCRAFVVVFELSMEVVT